MKSALTKIIGGLRLNGHKSESMRDHSQVLPLPDKLVIPLQQHIGQVAEPVVKAGDHVLKGQLLADSTDYVSAPIHAPTSGTIEKIESDNFPHPSGLATTCITLKPDNEDKWIEKNQHTNYEQLDAEELRNIIHQAGIVGLGGAGFPSYIKLNPGSGNKIDTLIINGAECEPYITCDAMLMQEQSRKIIDGLNILRHVLKVEQCIIAIEDNQPKAIEALQEALQSHENEYITVTRVPTIYPAGGEKQLILALTGKEVPKNGLPVNIGIIVHNIATSAAVADAVLQGKPLISRYVTVTGEGIDHPANLEVLIGTPFSRLIDFCGKNKNAEKIIMGGPMMGFEVINDDVPVIKTTNCILVQKKELATTVMPCIRCGKCAEVCPARLLPQQLYWYARSNNFDKTQDYNLFDCIECGCCAYVCPSNIPLVLYYRYAKTEIWTQEREKRDSDIARERHEFRQYRLERKKAEAEERKRKKRELLKKSKGKKDSDTDAKKAAIEAAMARVKAKRDNQSATPANTQDLTEEQKQKIAEVDARRKKMTEKKK